MLSRTRRVLLSGLLVAGGLGVGPAGGSLPSIGAIATACANPPPQPCRAWPPARA